MLNYERLVVTMGALRFMADLVALDHLGRRVVGTVAEINTTSHRLKG